MSISTKSKPSYIYAIVGVSLVLFFLGTIGWFVMNGRTLSKALKEQVLVSIDFHDNTTDSNIAKLRDVIAKQPFCKKLHYISKEEALKIVQIQEGENTGDLLSFNPMFASLEMNVFSEYSQIDSLEKIKQFIAQSNIVDNVHFNKMQVQQMTSNLRKINLILSAIALVLFFVVIILIDNTVRLAMFSNRFLIKTMQMVGATRYFIARPFDTRAIINGLISSGIAILGLILVISFIEGNYPELNYLHDTGMITLLFLAIILTGVLISFFSTHRSVIKYLKMHVEDLY